MPGPSGRGHPDLFRFPLFSSNLFQFAFLVYGVSSDLFRFAPICSDVFSDSEISEQIRTNQGNPFLPTPFASPRLLPSQLGNEKSA